MLWPVFDATRQSSTSASLEHIDLSDSELNGEGWVPLVGLLAKSESHRCVAHIFCLEYQQSESLWPRQSNRQDLRISRSKFYWISHVINIFGGQYQHPLSIIRYRLESLRLLDHSISCYDTQPQQL